MRNLRWLVPVAVALTAAACTTTLNPGRCNQTSDCAAMAAYAGYVCDLDPNVQGDGRCVPPCSSNTDCQGGRTCSFDSQNIGRCLLPIDGGTSGAGGQGGTTGTGGSGGPGGSGGSAGAGGSTDGGQDTNTCACGGNTPVCLQGSCVQCVASSDCTADATKPICDTTSHSCVACSSDSQCVAKLGSTGNPGVCMSQTDGHCATDAETVYVQNSSACTSTTGSGGTATVPYCSMEPVGIAANATHTVVVIRGPVNAADWTYQRGIGSPETSFIGQQSALIASGASPAFNMDSGTVYFRNLRVSSSAAICIQATGGTLDLDTVDVDTCAGGGVLLDGAAFNISKTTVTNCGPGQTGAIAWGGILVNSLPTSGQTTLNLVTIQANKQLGLDCSSGIQGTGVFATGNTGGEVATTCAITTCSPLSTTCGAP